ncbi:tRNA(Met)-cytidine N(4)-acetyltransferase [Vibrio sp. ES.051]|uniref:tRNA(Met) cytidine acetyltransferase TmcA n=1 Tax=Vibrio sp. ES.051 TaxID=1761909 RepID=UPI000BF33F0D|nr:GNAT family N-acetyltransferase [Vibrio sp. ES.051]PFG58641.1 tRNA(Met)-cytidine N(4)-acetyltransferase [Vibrio sp. ES.051]
MYAQSDFLSLIQQKAHQSWQRFGVVLQGESKWQDDLVSVFHKTQHHQRWFCVGDWSLESTDCVSAKQGHMLLGRECDVLLFDARQHFDANSFTAALGALVGGGILIVVVDQHQSINYAQQWIQMQWQKLTVLEQHKHLPALPESTTLEKQSPYSEQQHVVCLIEKVVTGHRKRPLVLTADRGRGKTSALGIACAHLLQQKPLRILLTAPSMKAVEPVYQHALRLVHNAQRIKKDRLEIGQGYIQFIAPDELLSSLPECDLLLVDEAAAIPVPMLKSMTERYHRLVFSSTVHGYEGCGRGFTVKFIEWLQRQRPGIKTCHMKQPIRWSESDKLESWLYDAFLLDAELTYKSIEGIESVCLSKVDKQALLLKPNLLRECFALLVNAHYQTSPNDLIHLLQDDRSEVYIATHKNDIVGVLLTVEEGGLDAELIKDVQLGTRRPKGHLTPITIVNQLGFANVGELSTLRVMRIAVHPELQGQGIGQKMLQQLELFVAPHISYLSTSFGATEELIHFWQKSGFQSIRLGTMRDAASGSYSLLMVRQCGSKAQAWIAESQTLFKEMLFSHVAYVYPKLEPSLFRILLQHSALSKALHPAKQALIESYAHGGSSFESVSLWLQQRLLQRGLGSVSDLMISKLFLNRDWAECGNQFGLSGRKQVEQQLREEVKKYLE